MMKLKQIVTVLLCALFSTASLSGECVVLLHGLARSAGSMNELETKLEEQGYIVSNIDYPSRELKIEELAELAVTAGLAQCEAANAHPVNFVTHSLGGILVRQFYSVHEPDDVKRVVMLGPPNQGSQVVDRLKTFPGFKLLNGPAGMQLGTDKDSVPLNLGPVNFELGVIAGTQSINLILSSFLPNPDDGKVSVARTKVEGMCGFVTLPTAHPFMMNNDMVISEVIHFLQIGRFERESAIPEGCVRPN